MAVDIGMQIDEILTEYADRVKETAQKDIKAVAKESVQKLKATSPVGDGKQKGRYASGWTSKKDGDGMVVYNRTDAGLTHLLEYGHNLRQGGRWGGSPHIKDVEEWVKVELPKRVQEDLES